MEKEVKTIVPNQKEMFKEIDEINLRSGGDWERMCFEDRKRLVDICRVYKKTLDRYVQFVYTLANVTDEQLINEEKLRLKNERG